MKIPHSLITIITTTTLLLTTLVACGEKTPEVLEEPPLLVGDDSEPINPEIKIGVVSCDNLLGKYRTCLARLPDNTRQSMQIGLTKAEQTWIKISKQPNSEEKLTRACEKMDASLSQAMRAQGCKWE